MGSTWPPDGYELEPFEYGGIRRSVFRLTIPTGPPVLLFHELGGLNDSTLAVAAAIAGNGSLSPVLPALVGPPGRNAWYRNVRPLCVGWEFVTWATNRTSPIVGWLRALARRESERADGARVGVVGMCFSGGFALSMVVDPNVAVAVAGQPSLPLTWKGWPGAKARDLGISPGDLACVRGRLDRGEVAVRAVRYADDSKSPRARMQALEDTLGDGVVMTPLPGKRHSVLADGAAGENGPAIDALAEIVGLLEAELLSPDRRPGSPRTAG